MKLAIVMASALLLLSQSACKYEIRRPGDAVTFDLQSNPDVAQHQIDLGHAISSLKNVGAFIGVVCKFLGTDQILSELEWLKFVQKNNQLLKVGKDIEGPTFRLLDRLYSNGAFKEMFKKRIDLFDGFTIVLMGTLFLGDSIKTLTFDKPSQAEIETVIVPNMIKGVGMLAGGSVSILMWAAKHQGDPDARRITEFFGGLIGNRIPVLFNGNGLEKQSLAAKLEKLSAKATVAKKLFYIYQGINRLTECGQNFSLFLRDNNTLDRVDHTEQAVASCGSGLNLIVSEITGNKLLILPYALFEVAIFMRKFDGEPPLIGPLLASLRKEYLDPTYAPDKQLLALQEKQMKTFKDWNSAWERGCRTLSTDDDCTKVNEALESEVRKGIELSVRQNISVPPYSVVMTNALNGTNPSLQKKYYSMLRMVYRGDEAMIRYLFMAD